MSENGNGTIALEGALDLAAAQPLARRLLTHAGSDLNLDASRAQRLGAPCAQVLLSARETWRRAGRSLRVHNPSSEFSESLRLLGLEPQLIGDL